MWGPSVSPGITCGPAPTKPSLGAIAQANPVALTVTGTASAPPGHRMIASVGGRPDQRQAVCDHCGGRQHHHANGIWTARRSALTSGARLHPALSRPHTTATAKDLTSAATPGHHQWALPGVAAHSGPWVRAHVPNRLPQNGFYKRVGKSTNQVLSAATSGDGWTLTGLGLPLSTGKSDGHQFNLFGADKDILS